MRKSGEVLSPGISALYPFNVAASIKMRKSVVLVVLVVFSAAFNVAASIKMRKFVNVGADRFVLQAPSMWPHL